MPGATVDSGMGATIVFGTSGFTGNLLDIKFGGVKREAIATSHMGITAPGSNKFGNKTFIASDLSDPGEVTFTVHLNTGQSGATAQPPIDKVAETITVTFPLATGGSTAATWAFTGFVTDFDVDVQMEDAIKATVKVKISGNVSITAAT